MGTVRRQFTKEFKQEAVRLIQDQGLSVAQASRDLGVNANMLYRWKQESREHGQQAFPGHGLPIEAELARLRQELETVKRERDILKKATVFFAKYQDEA
jgi:transposase